MMPAVLQIIAFVVFAFIAIAGALGMATTMSMFRSGIFLMASFLGVAGLFILLSADLLGLLQIMMYIGGMLVMILFMVLFMHDPGGAMMAGMDMAPIERWFSLGLVPRAAKHEEREHPAHAAQEDHAARHEQHGAGSDKGEDEGKRAEMQMGGMDMSDMSMVTPVRPLAAWLAVAVGLVLVGMLVLRPAWRVVGGVPDPDSARRIGHLLMEKYMVAFEGAGVLILIGIFGAVLLARPSHYPDDPSRAARVAVDKPPEPIADDRLTPLRREGNP
jgi:NADH-quinone oxidoreductase subunit J